MLRGRRWAFLVVPLVALLVAALLALPVALLVAALSVSRGSALALLMTPLWRYPWRWWLR